MKAADMRRDLPVGLVTLVFTDIEGSTRLLEELGTERYGEVLSQHHRVCRVAWVEHGGVEVDTAGDAFFVVFDSASGALAAAGEAQEALAELGLRVRMGVHTGEVSLNETGYVGFEVHRAARIAASAHGGQVVVSGTTAAAAGRSGLIELGEHRFKDVDEPIAIFQLGEGSFPPLKTLSNTNLPRPASSFVGREHELGEVLSRFEHGARLVTLTGPGGSGKSRLALEAAATLVPEFKAGVFWVGLAPLRDPALVTETIAQTLGAKDGLAEHVGERELLLLLDNLEQVIDAAPELSGLVRACPNLSLLVTSRELLRVDGEVEYAVPPLAEPEAVALFCDRAQAQPSDEIRELCARLDNLPLAVELAAARTRALSPGQILQRLSQRLDLLKGGRDADPRQQTLRATIEWSYDLLDTEEQRLFRALSVFAGGCTLEAAEEVADADLDTLQSLLEKSLLRFTSERYWMLETIREYAHERSAASADAQPIVERFIDRFVAFASDVEPELKSHGQQVAVGRLDDERENLRTVLRELLDREDADRMVQLAAALTEYWDMRSAHAEAELWWNDALARPSLTTRSRGTALRGRSLAVLRRGDLVAAREAADEAAVVFETVGDDAMLALSLANAAHATMLLGDDARGAEIAEAAAVHARRSKDLWVVGWAANVLGVAVSQLGDRARARALLEESVRCYEALGDERNRVIAVNNLGEEALADEDYERAADLFGEVLSLVEELDDRDFQSNARLGLATTCFFRGRLDEATHHLAISLTIALEIGARTYMVEAMLLAALVAAGSGRERDAVRLWALSEALNEGVGYSISPSLRPARESHLRSLRERLGEEFDSAWESGKRARLEDVVLELLGGPHGHDLRAR